MVNLTWTRSKAQFLSNVRHEQDIHSNETDVLAILKTTAQSIKQDLAVHIEMLTPSQLAVFSYISKTSGSEQILAFVTGGGGCGKSFLLLTLRRLFEYKQGKSSSVLATSGSAAVLINAQTIHRFFRLDTYLSTAIQHESSDFLSVRETDVLIIDEISMMSARLLEVVDTICREAAFLLNSKRYLLVAKMSSFLVIFFSCLL